MTGAAEAVAAPAQGLVQSPRNVAPIGTASEGIRNMDPECSGAPLLRFARWRSHVALVVAFAVVITARAPAPAKGPGGLPGNGNTGARPWIDARCGGCHQTEDPFTHPVGVVPSMPIPPGLPLEDGRIECTTCHDNRASADHARAREFHAPLLRQEPADLCAACHDPAGTSRRDMHATMLGRAHLRTRIAGRRAPADGLPGRIRRAAAASAVMTARWRVMRPTRGACGASLPARARRRESGQVIPWASSTGGTRAWR
ncbi:MAG: hypothetical protein ACYS1B_00580 [Planctomycetota bacterium]|jgi:hypothetical protein